MPDQATAGPIASPTLAALYPSSASLPSNLLRFHLHFSEPVGVFDAVSAVRLLDADGDTVPDPFLDLGDGLWNAEGTVLTVLLHPGRIKAGVGAQAQRGSALRVHREYRLAVDIRKLCRDGHGPEAWRSYPFFVSAPLARPIEPRIWRIAAPRRATRDPIVISFDRPMDRLGIENGFALLDDYGEPIAFAMTVLQHERGVSLAPRRTWHGSAVRLQVHPELEDVAGNRVGQAFESGIGGASNATSSEVPIALSLGQPPAGHLPSKPTGADAAGLPAANRPLPPA